MVTAYDDLLRRVQGLLSVRDLNVVVDVAPVRQLVEDEVDRFQREATIGAGGAIPFANPTDVVGRLLRDIGGLGAEIEALSAKPELEEMYGTDGELIYRTNTGETRAVSTPISPTVMLNTVQRMVAAAGGRLDASHPRADGLRVFLPDGRQGRLSASIYPRIEGTIHFTLRLPQKRHTTLDDLVGLGSLTPLAALFLAVLMRIPRLKLLVVGPPGAGKTTLLDALLRALSPRRRTIVLEENRELTAPLLNGEYWATSGVEDLPDLIRSARVNSPQLIALGELKGREAWDLVMAGNLGTGVIAAVHADNAAQGFDALADAASAAVPAMSTEAIRAKFARIFDVVVFVDIDDEDDDRALRQITEIAVVPPQLSTAAVAVTPIFARSDIGAPMELRATDIGPELERQCNRVLRRHRVTITELLNGAPVTL